MSRISGRFSRYPAVDRGVDSSALVEEVTPVQPEIVVPDGMTIPETVEWVGNDDARRQAAIDAEHASAKPRTTLFDALDA